VHEIKEFVGPHVVATNGTRVPVREAHLVKKATAVDVQIPRALQGRRSVLDASQKVALKPYAVALRGFMGGASMSTQAAGIKLRSVPGFPEAMVQQKLVGTGAFQKFLGLFPEYFEIEGVAPKAVFKPK
jgi:hypothetical protein